MRKSGLISAVYIIFLFIQALNVSAQTINIDLNTKYQTISGFGGMNMPGWIPDLTEDQTDKAFGNEPGQLGLTLLRVRVPNDSNQFYKEVPTAVRAIKHGAKIFATPWSPPASLKSNKNLIGGYLLPSSYNDFANHLLGFASYMNKNSASLYAISLQNEPDIKVDYESCDWSAKQFNNFLNEQGQRFDSVKLIAPESFNFSRKLTDSILNDTEAVQHVDIIGGHIYGKGLSDYPLAREKGKEVWMTEHFTESNNPANLWPLALDVATEINNCMQTNFNAYVWWYIRRSYGLIDEAGNITKRGYIMAQFSKFIRPGSIRVNASIVSASNADVTAYKTDTSLVIVVVNKNSSPINLNFNVQNVIVSTLYKYTTSEGKNIENNGILNISGGVFNASVDASSITTFTSYSGNAGKNANVLPVANAGKDQEFIDNDSNGKERIILNGSGSNDPDGNIKNYSWSSNGAQVAWGSKYESDFNVGEYDIVLTVTDNDGATSSDTVHISIKSLNKTQLWFEAECGIAGLQNWNVSTDTEASNGKYVMVKAGTQSLSAASTDENDHLTFTFHITEAGSFKLWGRAKTPTANDDSYWVKMDDGPWANWNSIPASATWKWDDVHDQANDNPVTYKLDTGFHAIRICYREDGAALDKLCLTNTGSIPSGIGEIAGNCPKNASPVANAGSDQSVTINSESAIVNVDASGSKDPDGTIIDYSWKEIGKVIATGLKPELKLTIGIHYVYLVVTDNEGATDTDSVTISVTKKTSILTENNKDLNFYPNPITDHLIIANIKNYNSVAIYDLSGQNLINMQLKEIEHINVNISGLKSGLYLLYLTGKSKRDIFKLVKK